MPRVNGALVQKLHIVSSHCFCYNVCVELSSTLENNSLCSVDVSVSGVESCWTAYSSKFCPLHVVVSPADPTQYIRSYQLRFLCVGVWATEVGVQSVGLNWWCETFMLHDLFTYWTQCQCSWQRHYCTRLSGHQGNELCLIQRSVMGHADATAMREAIAWARHQHRGTEGCRPKAYSIYHPEQ